MRQKQELCAFSAGLRCFGFGYVEHLAQVGEEGAVVGHGFARRVGQLGDGLPVAFDQFQDDIQGRMPHIVGQVGADAEAGFEAVFEILVQCPRAFDVQPVGEGQHFGAAVDFELLIVGVGFVAPNVRVAAVVAQTVEEFGEIEVEIAQEGIHTDHVGQGNAQIAPVFVYPAFERGFLEIPQAHVEGLEGLEELVRHGADGGDAEFFGEKDIAGAAYDAGCGFKQGADDVFLPRELVAAACAEVGNQEGRFVGVLCGGDFFQARGFGLKPAFAFFDNGGGFQPAEVKFVDNGEDEDFKKHRLYHRAFDADVQTAFIVCADFDKAALELEEFEIIDKVAFDEAQAAEVVEFVVGEAQPAERVEFGFQVFPDVGKRIGSRGIAASEFVKAVRLRKLVQNYLQHSEFVEVGVKQRMYDAGHMACLPISVGGLGCIRTHRARPVCRKCRLKAFLDDWG